MDITKEELLKSSKPKLADEIIELYGINDKLRAERGAWTSTMSSIIRTFALHDEFVESYVDVNSTVAALCSSLLSARRERDSLIKRGPKKRITNVYISEQPEFAVAE